MTETPSDNYWNFPDPRDFPHDDEELIAIGGDLEPSTLIDAYRLGLFPMPLSSTFLDGSMQPIGWWSPNPRGIIPLNGFHASRSLRRSAKRYEIRVDTAFDAVIDGCADPSRPNGWINDNFKRAYRQLHQMGVVHSFEAWSIEDDQLCGGTYGVAIGGLFAAESMFHLRTDAGKIAIAGMVEILNRCDFKLLDIQWRMDNTAALGAIEIPRREYLDRLTVATQHITTPICPGTVLKSLTFNSNAKNTTTSGSGLSRSLN